MNDETLSLADVLHRLIDAGAPLDEDEKASLHAAVDAHASDSEPAPSEDAPEAIEDDATDINGAPDPADLTEGANAAPF